MRARQLQVLGTVKNAGLVIFCVIFLAETVTTVQGTGYSVALLGFSWYQYIKTVGGPAKARAPQVASQGSQSGRGSRSGLAEAEALLGQNVAKH